MVGEESEEKDRGDLLHALLVVGNESEEKDRGNLLHALNNPLPGFTDGGRNCESPHHQQEYLLRSL